MRQPRKRCAGLDFQIELDGRVRRKAAINLLCGGGGDEEPRSGPHGHFDREAVTPRHSTRSIHDDRFELRRGRTWAAHPQRTFLAQARTPRHPAENDRRC